MICYNRYGFRPTPFFVVSKQKIGFSFLFSARSGFSALFAFGEFNMYDDENYEQAQYFIPINIGDDGGVLGGRFKKRNMIEAVVIGLLLTLVWKIIFYPYDIIVKIVAYIILVIPVVLFAIVGVNNESFLEFLLEYLAYKKKRRKMKFRLPMKLSEKRKKKLLGK